MREVFSHFAYLADRLLGPLEPVSVRFGRPDGPDRAEETAAGHLRAGGVPVHVSAAVAAAPETYAWTLWGTDHSFRLRNWSQLSVSDGGVWERVLLPGEPGSETTRLSLFARAVRGERHPDIADFATGFRVQEVVEAFHAAPPASIREERSACV